MLGDVGLDGVKNAILQVSGVLTIYDLQGLFANFRDRESLSEELFSCKT